MGSCAAPSAKGDDKFITTDYLQQCPVDFFGWDGGFMVMIGGSVLAVLLLVVVMIGEKRHHAEVLARRQ